MEFNFFGWGKACFSCGSLFHLSGLDLCRVCYSYLEKARSPKGFSSGQNDFKKPIYYLFDWQRSSNPVLNQLIYELKGGQARKSFQILGTRLINQRILWGGPALLNSPNVIFVPAPASLSLDKARNNSAIDHAGRLALELHGLCKSRIENALIRTEAAPQHKKNKKDRQKIRLKLRSSNGFKQHPKDLIVFVDDVVTTGATALKAWQVLGRPNHFEVWCLALRG